MIVLICGDRNWSDSKLIENEVRKLVAKYGHELCILEGDANGADRIAGEAACRFGVALLVAPANWTFYGRRAGPIRNSWMMKYGRPELVLAFHDDIESSKGTRHMINQAKKTGVKTRLIVHA